MYISSSCCILACPSVNLYGTKFKARVGTRKLVVDLLAKRTELSHRAGKKSPIDSKVGERREAHHSYTKNAFSLQIGG
jgi:hypothetical protein